jgi:hypothetical protein
MSYMACKRSLWISKRVTSSATLWLQPVLDSARLLTILLEGPLHQRQQQPHDPWACVSIISCSRVLAGPTGANVVRARSVNGPNRDTTVELLTGSYSVTSMLPWISRPRSIRTSRAVVPTPIGPGVDLVIELIAGSTMRWFRPGEHPEEWCSNDS